MAGGTEALMNTTLADEGRLRIGQRSIEWMPPEGAPKDEARRGTSGLRVLLVERRRIELPTFALRTRRSPS
jgi:hypothetical protein